MGAPRLLNQKSRVISASGQLSLLRSWLRTKAQAYQTARQAVGAW